MKTLKLYTLAIAMVAMCGFAKADGKGDDVTSKNYALNTYVNAMTHGKLDGFADILDPTAKFSLMQGSHVGSYGKKDMLDFMKKLKNVEEDCTSNTAIIESNANVAVARVDMQFSSGFTRSNYVTLANTGKGWKIINVYSVFN